MASYCKKYNFIYFHYPKTGGTTFRDALEKAFGKHKIYGSVHTTYQEACNISGQNFESTYKIMTIRNPWGRFYSHWKHQVRAFKEKNKIYPYTFEEYILMCPKTKKSDFIVSPATYRMQQFWNFDVIHHGMDKNNNIVIDKFIPLDKLQVEFDMLCERFKVKSFQIGKQNASGSQDGYIPHYTPIMRNIIAKHCEEEIDYFGYNFEL